MSLASCICTLTSICHVAAVTEGQSRGHQHKKSMSPSAAPQTGTDVVFVEELHDGLEIRFVDAVCGTQQADSRLARWTSSVAPQHPAPKHQQRQQRARAAVRCCAWTLANGS